MRIPGKNAFGNVIAQPGPIADTSAKGRAAANLGNTIANIGGAIQDQRLEKMRLDADRTQQLARAKDAGALLDHQLQVKRLEQDYTDRLSRGDIRHEDAQAAFDADVQALPAPKPQAQGRLAEENLKNGVRQIIEGAKLNMSARVRAAQDQDMRSQGVAQLDILGKQGSLPGADVEMINKQAEAVLPLLRQGGLTETEATRTIQNFKDANWYNQASQKGMVSRESMTALKQLEHDLTADDGFYIGKLDTEKRNQVLNQVISHRLTLENKQLQHAAKRDTAAARTMNDIDRQITSGVPATPEMWSDWANKVHGTQFEQDYKDRLDDERSVQQMLRLPIDQQLKYVQDKQAALLNGGGTVRDATNLQRLSSAVQQNVKLLQDSPLQFNANRIGTDVQSLDMTELVNGESAGTMAAQIRDRVNTLSAMRKQYGDQVPMKPLLPQEAAMLASALDKSTPNEASQIFGGLYNAVSDDAAYMAAMQQVAPDSPVKAQAGMLAVKDAQLTTNTHWFKPNENISSKKVADTILRGQDLIAPSKTDKATNGAPKLSLYLPEQTSLQYAFQKAVGDAYAMAPQTAEKDFQAVKAYYVGKASETGRIASSNTDIDKNIVQEAVQNVLGNVINYNGNGKVIAPWGMDESTFRDRADLAYQQAVENRGLPNTVANGKSSIGLMNNGGGTYLVTVGKAPLLDPATHQPVIINVAAPIPVKKPLVRGRGVSGSETVME